MAVLEISQLKTNMPLFGANSVSAADIHDVLDTMEERTTQRISLKTASYTASVSDNRSKICFNSAAPATLTLPADIPAGWECLVSQTGSGQVSISASQGTILVRSGSPVTAGVNAVVYLLCIGNAGSSPKVVLAGDVSAVISQNWLNDLTNFGVWLTLSDPAVIGASEYDLMIIDPDEQTTAEMPVLRARPGGGTRKLAAYLSVGEAVNYRWYWQSAWNTTPPSWLGSENPNWPGAFRVQYWNQQWKDIIYASGATSSLGRILAAGFDAAFLDVVDTYAYWEGLGRATAADEMVQFVTELTAYARSVNPNFKIIAQNSAPLLMRNDYLAAIDAVSSESMWYSEEVPWTQGDLDWLLPKMANARAAGKRILNIEYTDEQAQINQVYTNNAQFNPKNLTYIAPLSLDTLWHRVST
jgi:cysteinyl-tRNA synthetase